MVLKSPKIGALWICLFSASPPFSSFSWSSSMCVVACSLTSAMDSARIPPCSKSVNYWKGWLLVLSWMRRPRSRFADVLRRRRNNLGSISGILPFSLWHQRDRANEGGLTLLAENYSLKILENSWKDVMYPYGTLLNHWRIVLVNVPMNILHRTTSDPPEIIIWALNAFRWLSGFSTPEKGVIFTVMKWVGIDSSIISCENDWGLLCDDMFGERARIFRLPCLCMVLRNFSFLFVVLHLLERRLHHLLGSFYFSHKLLLVRPSFFPFSLSLLT